MIERDMNGELLGQMDLGDLIQGTGNREQGTGMVEGYDAEGHLLNLDYPDLGKTPGASTVPASGADIPKGENGDNSQFTDPQTPAERLDVLAGEINAITTHARVVMATAAIDIGKRLMEARNLVPEGRWLEWLEKRVDYSERQAQVLMQIAQEYGRGELPEAFRGLGISHLTALLAAPAEDREAMAERVKDEDMSVRELQEEIKALKAERDSAQQSLFDTEYALNRTRREMEDVETERDNARENMAAARAAIEKEREAARLAEAKARAAEASAEELRRLHSDAEDRAAASAQRASDAVNRANQTAKELAEAKAKIQALSEAAANGPEVQTVEVVPEAMTRELEQLRRELAEAKAKALSGAAAPPPPEGEARDPAARFREFYTATMRPAFNTALDILRAVKADDANTADMLARAVMKGCEALLNQL